MRTIILTAIAAASLTLGASETFAGKSQKITVTITDQADGSIRVRGGVKAARNSTDTKQYIYCEVREGGNGLGIECGAADKNGRAVGCLTRFDNGKFLPAVGLINETSEIRFNVSTAGTCTGIQVHNDSRNL